MTKNSNWRPLALCLTAVGAAVRLLPHPPNFAPVGAIGMFGGARLPAWQAYLVPIALMAITDPIISAFYGVGVFTRFSIYVYASFLISVFIGRRLRGTENIPLIATAALLNSVQFFVITNFGSFLSFPGYPHTMAGLVNCYTSAIPFFGYTVASDLFYTAVLFGLYAWLSRTVAANERVAATA